MAKNKALPLIPSAFRTDRARDPHTERVNHPRFRRAQVQLIHQQMRYELLMNVGVVAAICVLFWETAPRLYIAGWSLLILLTLAWRSLFISFRTENEVSAWGKGYVFAALVSGMAWGCLGVVAYLYGDANTKTVTLVTLICITLAAYTSMQSSPRVSAAFAVPALLPCIYNTATTGEDFHIIMAASASLLMVMMFTWSRSFKTMLIHSIKLSSHNTELIHELIEARETAVAARVGLETANHELETQIYERRAAESRIRESKERIQAIIEGMQDTIFHVDKNGVIKWATPSIRQLLGYSTQEAVGSDVGMLFMSPEDRAKHDKELDTKFGGLQNRECMLRHKSGHGVWVSENCVYQYNEVGGITGHEATLRDITALKNTKEALFLAQEQAYVTLGSIGDGVIAVSMDGSIDYMNIVAEQGTGWNLEDAHGRALREVFMIVDEKTLQSIPDPVEMCLQEGRPTMLPGYLLLIHRHIQQQLSIEVNAAPIRNSNKEISGVVLVFHDVSELRSLAQMTYHATHDSLTGLINRREFEKRVNQALDYTRDRDKRYALCYLDLDQFKIVG